VASFSIHFEPRFEPAKALRAMKLVVSSRWRLRLRRRSPLTQEQKSLITGVFSRPPPSSKEEDQRSTTRCCPVVHHGSSVGDFFLLFILFLQKR
jgi:hypothetical protein